MTIEQLNSLVAELEQQRAENATPIEADSGGSVPALRAKDDEPIDPLE